MKRRIDLLISLLEDELPLFLSISVGVFLFVLSFQPFPHGEFDFYYRLLYKVGFGVIVLLIMFLVRILYPCLIEKISQSENGIVKFSYVSGFIIWVLSSFVFIWYLKYVGFISVSGYLIFKVVLICLAPPIILLVSDRMRKLKMENKSLIFEKEKNQDQDKKKDDDCQNLSIDFISGTNGGKLSFKLGEILFLKSANNYVEIHFLEEVQIKKKLIRNTLSNIELQIDSYPTLVRCHRTCIVNTQHIEKFNGNCNNRTLTITGYNKQIPVSRRYYLRVKETV